MPLLPLFKDVRVLPPPKILANFEPPYFLDVTPQFLGSPSSRCPGYTPPPSQRCPAGSVATHNVHCLLCRPLCLALLARYLLSLRLSRQQKHMTTDTHTQQLSAGLVKVGLSSSSPPSKCLCGGHCSLLQQHLQPELGDHHHQVPNLNYAHLPS